MRLGAKVIWWLWPSDWGIQPLDRIARAIGIPHAIGHSIRVPLAASSWSRTTSGFDLWIKSSLIFFVVSPSSFVPPITLSVFFCYPPVSITIHPFTCSHIISTSFLTRFLLGSHPCSTTPCVPNATFNSNDFSYPTQKDVTIFFTFLLQLPRRIVSVTLMVGFTTFIQAETHTTFYTPPQLIMCIHHLSTSHCPMDVSFSIRRLFFVVFFLDSARLTRTTNTRMFWPLRFC